ncbi:hypothetical protein NC652_018243 [Populus alba x Populus x berolinensis]|nr:hypothetical protein NC652_018243 [Populus alba x Populus x berolinensis]
MQGAGIGFLRNLSKIVRVGRVLREKRKMGGEKGRRKLEGMMIIMVMIGVVRVKTMRLLEK